MKEKTFEQLIKESAPDIPFNDKHDWDLPRFSGNTMKDFGQQVREATIAECKKCLTMDNHDDIPVHFIEQRFKINQLPTDRIKSK